MQIKYQCDINVSISWRIKMMTFQLRNNDVII